jgi:hypothetical protein
MLGLDNFLKRIHDLITGDGGFARDIPLSSSAMATTATRAQAKGPLPADIIILADNGEAAIVSGILPRDFDEDADVLKVSLRVVYASGTSIAIQGDKVSRQRTTGAFAELTSFVPATATTIASSPAGYTVTANLSGLGWKAGDAFVVRFVASAVTGAGEAHVLGGRVTIHSDLVAHDKNGRDARA